MGRAFFQSYTRKQQTSKLHSLSSHRTPPFSCEQCCWIGLGMCWFVCLRVCVFPPPPYTFSSFNKRDHVSNLATLWQFTSKKDERYSLNYAYFCGGGGGGGGSNSGCWGCAWDPYNATTRINSFSPRTPCCHGTQLDNAPANFFLVTARLPTTDSKAML